MGEGRPRDSAIPCFRFYFFPPQCRLALGPEWGPPAGCGGRISPRVDTNRSRPLSLFKGCSLFARRQSCFAASRPEARGEGTLSAPPESGRGVSPEPRVGISRAAAPSFACGWCPGHRSRKTSTVLGLEGARRGGKVPSHNLFCKPLKGRGVGVGNCPSAHSQKATAPADGGGEGGWGGVLSHRQAGSIRAQPRSDQTSQPSAVSQASDQ